jgi:quercetin dioxygenase-like cupin family protein
METLEDQYSIFPKGDRVSTEYFTGTAWITALVPNDSILNCMISNVVFEPGARTNWHTHSGGQILIVTDGAGYYQEEGKVIHLIQKGDVVKIKPNLKHWHGASPNSAFTHIAINPNAQNGAVDWLEKVTDEEYNKFKY